MKLSKNPLKCRIKYVVETYKVEQIYQKLLREWNWRKSFDDSTITIRKEGLGLAT